MDYNKIMDDYSPELQLIDMLDWLQHKLTGFEEIPEALAPHSNTARIDASSLPLDPTPAVSFPDTQLL